MGTAAAHFSVQRYIILKNVSFLLILTTSYDMTLNMKNIQVVILYENIDLKLYIHTFKIPPMYKFQ